MVRRLLGAAALAGVLALPLPAWGDAPRSVVDAIIQVESGGNPKVRGRAGEWGLMQIRVR